MITQRILFAAGFALLMGCSGAGTSTQEQAAGAIARTVQEVAISSGEPVTIADLSIEGMSCEMMCGGAIKKALAKLGVEGTEIKMSETEAPNHAIVTYSEAKVTEAQVVEAIQTLYDGQYKVVAIGITKQVKGGGGSVEQPKSEEKAMSVIAPKDIVLPSILALIGRLLRV
jgi:copper chaperone CopZ